MWRERVRRHRTQELTSGICTAFLAEQTWFRGRLHNLYSAFYFRVGPDRGHRIRVNCRGLTWRAVAAPKREERPLPAGFEARTVDLGEELGVVGLEVDRIEYREEFQDTWASDGDPFRDEAELTIHFWGERALRIRYYADDTTVRLIDDAENAEQR
jgi:hypothetical protein